MNPPYKLPPYSTILRDGLVIPDDISQIERNSFKHIRVVIGHPTQLPM